MQRSHSGLMEAVKNWYKLGKSPQQGKSCTKQNYFHEETIHVFWHYVISVSFKP